MTVGIAFRGVSFSWTAAPFFRDASFAISIDGENAGRFVNVIGKSGSGKSTLGNLILGIVKPSSGQINVTPKAARKVLVPQTPVLFDHLSLWDNIFLEIGGKRAASNEMIDDVLELADLMNVRHLIEADRRSSTLSGGEAQRISLLRAMYDKPDILVLDEPGTGLDPSARLQFLSMLKTVTSNSEVLGFYITHYPEEATVLSDEYLLVTSNDGVSRDIIGERTVEDLIPLHHDALKLLHAGSWLKVPIENLRRRGIELDPNTNSAYISANAISLGAILDLGFREVWRNADWIGLETNNTKQVQILRLATLCGMTMGDAGSDLYEYDQFGVGLAQQKLSL